MISESFLRSLNIKQFLDLAELQRKKMKVRIIRDFNKTLKENKVANPKQYQNNKHNLQAINSSNRSLNSGLQFNQKIKRKQKVKTIIHNIQIKLNKQQQGFNCKRIYKKPINYNYFRQPHHIIDENSLNYECCNLEESEKLKHDEILFRNKYNNCSQAKQSLLSRSYQKYQRFIQIMKNRKRKQPMQISNFYINI